MKPIDVTINYVVRGESAVFNAADRQASYWPQDAHVMPVHDLREELDELSFDRNGFVIARGPSEAAAMTDPAARMAAYGREAEALMEKL